MIIGDKINWAKPGSQTRIDLAKTGSVATAFTTTGGTSYAGQISVASTTGNSGVTREVWVSTCPGGEPLPDPKCSATGTSSTVIPWYQGPATSRYCNLAPNTNYYINYKNVNCTSSFCDVYRNLYNNNKPY